MLRAGCRRPRLAALPQSGWPALATNSSWQPSVPTWWSPLWMTSPCPPSWKVDWRNGKPSMRSAGVTPSGRPTHGHWYTTDLTPDAKVCAKRSARWAMAISLRAARCPRPRPTKSIIPGTYVAGLYNRLTSTIAGRQVENEDLVNLPNWLPLRFRIVDGPWFDMQQPGVEDHRL